MQDRNDVKWALVVIGVAVTVMGLVSGFVGVGPNCGSAFTGGNPFLESSSCDFLAAEARREAVRLIIGGLVLAFGGIVMLARQRNETIMQGASGAAA